MKHKSVSYQANKACSHAGAAQEKIEERHHIYNKQT
jgi:hypothetical protein